LFEIRDEDDYVVLHTAMMENVDVLISGDKDFEGIVTDKPEILKPAEFLTKYYNEH